MIKWILVLSLISQSHAVGKFIKETAKELGGELVKLGITTLAEVALDEVLEEKESSSEETESWWWWFKGIRN